MEDLFNYFKAYIVCESENIVLKNNIRYRDDVNVKLISGKKYLIVECDEQTNKFIKFHIGFAFVRYANVHKQICGQYLFEDYYNTLYCIKFYSNTRFFELVDDYHHTYLYDLIKTHYIFDTNYIENYYTTNNIIYMYISKKYVSCSVNFYDLGLHTETCDDHHNITKYVNNYIYDNTSDIFSSLNIKIKMTKIII